MDSDRNATTLVSATAHDETHGWWPKQGQELAGLRQAHGEAGRNSLGGGQDPGMGRGSGVSLAETAGHLAGLESQRAFRSVAVERGMDGVARRYEDYTSARRNPAGGT